MKRLLATISGLILLSGAASAPAHHSFAMFDNKQCREISGAIRNYQWAFPHVWIWLNVPNRNGGFDVWGFEGEPPSNLSQDGWTRVSLKKGDQVKVRYSPLRDNRNGGAFSVVTLANGTVLASQRGPTDTCTKGKH